jgi:hypothetical protein
VVDAASGKSPARSHRGRRDREGRFSVACSILFYISQLIGMAMISLAFGKFAARLVGIEGELPFWERVLDSGLILGLSALALVGTKVVGELQRKVVLANLILLAGFAVALSRWTAPTRLRRWYMADTSARTAILSGMIARRRGGADGTRFAAGLRPAAKRMASEARPRTRRLWIRVALISGT